jgi:hypothetical protein
MAHQEDERKLNFKMIALKEGLEAPTTDLTTH